MEKKTIYKANKKAILKLFGVAVAIYICILLFNPVKAVILKWYKNTWTWYEFKDYNIAINVPRAYENITEKSNPSNDFLSSVTTEENIEYINDYSIKEPEVIYYASNSLNGISIMVQALMTEKTTRTLDDIADSQHALIMIYYGDDSIVGNHIKENVTVLNNDAIRVTTDIEDKSGIKTMVNYLVPTDDEEVTVTFLGLKGNMQKNDDQIRKIMNEMKFLK